MNNIDNDNLQTFSISTPVIVTDREDPLYNHEGVIEDINGDTITALIEFNGHTVRQEYFGYQLDILDKTLS